jgi:hypothetical protein
MYSGTDKAKMAYAFFQMTKCNHQHARQITSRQYERAKEAMSTVKGENHPAYGKSFWNDEDRSRMSLSKQGELNPMFGKPSWNKGLDSSDPRIASISEKSTATRKEKFAAGLYGDNYKRSEKHKKIVGDTMRGKPKSEEHRKKLSEAFKGVKQSRSVCPHCNKEGGSSAMKRFHFDNCKYK